MSVEDRVRKLRNDLGLKQDEFSDIIGVGRATLSEIERGKTKLSVPALGKIMSGFSASSTLATDRRG